MGSGLCVIGGISYFGIGTSCALVGCIIIVEESVVSFITLLTCLRAPTGLGYVACPKTVVAQP